MASSVMVGACGEPPEVPGVKYSRKYRISLLAAGPGVLACSLVACIQMGFSIGPQLLFIVPCVFVVLLPGIPLLAISISGLMPDPFRRPIEWAWIPVLAAASIWHVAVHELVYRAFGEQFMPWSVIVIQGACMAIATSVSWAYVRNA